MLIKFIFYYNKNGDFMNYELITFLTKQNLYNEDFERFMEGKIIVVPNTTEIFWYGCFPIIEDNNLKDIRLLVPEIETETDLLINIHEFTHAIELYEELNTPYIERREERENKAKTMEKLYLKNKK